MATKPSAVAQRTPRHNVPPTPVVAPTEALRPAPAVYQRCLRCGTDENSGSFCTWCQMAASDLIDHAHMPGGSSCPLGPYKNPSFKENRIPAKQAQLARDRAAWDASHDPAEAEPYIVRRWHHPENPRMAGDAKYLERHPDAVTIAAGTITSAAA